MGIILIGILLILVAVFCYKVDWDEAGFGATCVSLIILVISIPTVIITNNSWSNEIQYQNLLEQKQNIEYRLEQCKEDSNIMVNGGVFSDVTNYNNTLREYKTLTHNFWIGWFFPDKPAELDYIVLDKDVS